MQAVFRIIPGLFARVSMRLIIAIFFIFVSSSGGEEKTSGVASLDYLEGVARVRNPGSEGWLKIGESFIISVGDSTRTLADSRAEIRLSDGQFIRIGSSTIIGIVDTAEVALESGEIWAVIKRVGQIPNMKITSPVLIADIAEATARFSVGEDGTTEMKVYDGQIGLRILPGTALSDSTSSDSISYEAVDTLEITAHEIEVLLETSQKIIVTSSGEIIFHGDFNRNDPDENTDWVRWNKERDQGEQDSKY